MKKRGEQRLYLEIEGLVSGEVWSDHAPLQGLDHGLEAGLCMQLLVDVVQMVAYRPHTDLKVTRHLVRRLAVCQEAQNLCLLLREGCDRGRVAFLHFLLHKALGHQQHPVRERVHSLSLFYVAHEVDGEARVCPAAEGHQDGDVNPNSLPRIVPDLHVEIGNLPVSAYALENVTVLSADVPARPQSAADYRAAVLPESDGGRVAEELFGRFIPSADLACQVNCEGCVRCSFQKYCQLPLYHLRHRDNCY